VKDSRGDATETRACTEVSPLLLPLWVKARLLLTVPRAAPRQGLPRPIRVTRRRKKIEIKIRHPLSHSKPSECQRGRSGRDKVPPCPQAGCGGCRLPGSYSAAAPWGCRWRRRYDLSVVAGTSCVTLAWLWTIFWT